MDSLRIVQDLLKSLGRFNSIHLTDKGCVEFSNLKPVRLSCTYKGKTRTIASVMLELYKGLDPYEPWALHTCDNPRCINPKHLYWGHASQNRRDVLARSPTIRNTKVFGKVKVKSVKFL